MLQNQRLKAPKAKAGKAKAGAGAAAAVAGAGGGAVVVGGAKPSPGELRPCSGLELLQVLGRHIHMAWESAAVVLWGHCCR